MEANSLLKRRGRTEKQSWKVPAAAAAVREAPAHPSGTNDFCRRAPSPVSPQPHRSDSPTASSQHRNSPQPHARCLADPNELVTPKPLLQKTLNACFASQARGPSHHVGRCCLPIVRTSSQWPISPPWDFQGPMNTAVFGLGCPALAPTVPGVDRLTTAETSHPQAPASAQAKLHQTSSTRGQRMSWGLLAKAWVHGYCQIPGAEGFSPLGAIKLAVSATTAL